MRPWVRALMEDSAGTCVGPSNQASLLTLFWRLLMDESGLAPQKDLLSRLVIIWR